MNPLEPPGKAAPLVINDFTAPKATLLCALTRASNEGGSQL